MRVCVWAISGESGGGGISFGQIEFRAYTLCSFVRFARFDWRGLEDFGQLDWWIV